MDNDTLSGESQARDLPFLMRHTLDADMLDRFAVPSTGHAGADAVVPSVIAAAIIAERHGAPATSYSRNRNFYIGAKRYGGSHFNLPNVTKAVEHVAAMGWITMTMGVWRSKSEESRQSTFKAAGGLMERATVVGGVRMRPGETIILKDEDKELTGYRDTRETLAMRRDLKDWTESVSSSDVRVDAPDVVWVENGSISIPLFHDGKPVAPMFVNDGEFEFRRIFNNGRFTQGGRTYGHWSACLPSARRAQITIDAAPVALLDFGASHPRMLYAMAGVPLDGDPYEIQGVDRETAKVALMVILNARTRREGVEAVAAKLAGNKAKPTSEDRKKVETTQEDRKAADTIMRALEARHAPIASYFNRGSGIACQRIESDILNEVAKRGRKDGIVTLPVHDEMIGQDRHAARIEQHMSEAWTDRLGVRPVIKRG